MLRPSIFGGRSIWRYLRAGQSSPAGHPAPDPGERFRRPRNTTVRLTLSFSVKKLAGVLGLEIDIVLADFRTKTDFLQFHMVDFVVLVSLALLLVLELAVSPEFDRPAERSLGATSTRSIPAS